MKIDQQQLQRLATFARLRIPAEELPRYEHDLTKILDFVDQLQEADVSSLKDMRHVTPLRDAMRDDTVDACKIPDELIDAFPEKENRSLKVDSIL